MSFQVIERYSRKDEITHLIGYITLSMILILIYINIIDLYKNLLLITHIYTGQKIKDVIVNFFEI